jgi:hypothetical protein
MQCRMMPGERARDAGKSAEEIVRVIVTSHTFPRPFITILVFYNHVIYVAP